LYKKTWKKLHFCLFKIVTQGVSLWHSMYIWIKGVGYFLLSALVPFLCGFWPSEPG
jgi:hypothetical protein